MFNDFPTGHYFCNAAELSHTHLLGIDAHILNLVIRSRSFILSCYLVIAVMQVVVCWPQPSWAEPHSNDCLY